MAAKVSKTFKYYERIGDNRLMAGLMHIIIRNDMESYDDCIEEYKRNWGRTAVTGGGPDTNAKNSHPFNNTEIDTDPDRTDDLKAIGDYDTYLFFVTVAANIRAHEDNGSILGGAHTGSDGASVLTDGTKSFNTNNLASLIIKNITDGSQGTITSNTSNTITTSGGLSGGTDDEWATDDVYQIANTGGNLFRSVAPSHSKCQSFVRYHLLSRHNNTDGHSNNNYLFYGQPVIEYGNTTATNATEAPLVDQLLIGGAQRKIVNTGLYAGDNFGADLTEGASGNTFFSPASLIEIWGKHGITNNQVTAHGSTVYYALDTHDTTFYNLIVDIDLHGYVNPASATVAFFRNKTNIFFQPFGESTEVQFSTSEFTS